MILALTGLGLLGAAFQGLAANAIVPLFASVAGGTVDDPISRTISAVFGRLGLPVSIWPLLGLIAMLSIAQAFATFAVNAMRARLTTRYEEDARRRLFSAFLRARWPFLLEQKLGHLETVLMTNVRYAAVLLEHLTTLIVLGVSIVVLLAISLCISPIITIIVIGVGGLVFTGIRPLFKNTSKFSKVMEHLYRDTSHFLNQHVLGMKAVKSLATESRVEEEGAKRFSTFASTMRRIMIMRAGGDAIFQPVGILFVCGIFAFSAKSGAGLGAAAAMIFLTQRMFSYFPQAQASLRAATEFLPYMREVVAVEDVITKNLETSVGSQAFHLDHELAFKDIDFSYPDGRHALDHVNFTIRKGETVGIIGPSGAGKTTLVDMFIRLFEPTRGTISVDGTAATQFGLEDWRRNVGYVGQDIFLLNDTVANNIRFYSDISVADMHAAAQQAAIHDTIMSLPQGYETLVGERGVTMSGGQRQRIIIARVLARKPSVLVLDEATSALDNESEARIQSVIAGLHGKLTVLIIAHRLSTVLGSDRIIALDKGRVVEVGEPKQLMENPSSYLSKAYHAGKNL